MTTDGFKTAKKDFALLLSSQSTLTMLPYRNARHAASTRYNGTGQRFILDSLLKQTGALLWGVTVRRLSHKSSPMRPNMTPSPVQILRLYFQLQNCPFPPYFVIKTLNAFLVSPIRATYPTYLNLIETASLKVLLG